MAKREFRESKPLERNLWEGISVGDEKLIINFGISSRIESVDLFWFDL